MAQEKVRVERAEELPMAMVFSQFAEGWRNSVEGLFHAQEDFIDNITKANQKWVERFQSEANLSSEWGSKLAGSRTLPEALMVGQGWASQRLQMMAEDRKHLLEDYQHFAEIGARLCANGSTSNRPSGQPS
jgi:hypothetical protein